MAIPRITFLFLVTILNFSFHYGETVSFALASKPNVLVSSSNEELLQDQGVRGIYWASFAGYPASTINTSYFSHIYYAFVRPSPTTYVLNITDSDVEKLLKFANSSSRWNPPAKTLLAIGGFGGGALSGIFSQMASQENSRATFINSTIKILRGFNFNGIDLTGEFPPEFVWICGYLGMSAKKIVMGLPLYGVTWRLQDPNVNTIRSPTIGTGPGNGTLVYSQVVDFNRENNATIVFDNTRISFYSYAGDSWISYEDVRSIEPKVKYARDQALGGYFFWALGQDLDWTLSSKASQAWLT
ncbi:acidic mammalian chitinase-like protein [Tanacetum coccineum]